MICFPVPANGRDACESCATANRQPLFAFPLSKSENKQQVELHLSMRTLGVYLFWQKCGVRLGDFVKVVTVIQSVLLANRLSLTVVEI